MYKLVFCYPSSEKENAGTEMLYSPLALAYLANHTPDNYQITHYDEYVGENLDPHTVEADLVAFSPLSSGIMRTYELASVLRKRGIICVVGGAHATALPEEVLKQVDVVIKGEGEKPWEEFLKDYEKGQIKDIYECSMNVSLDSLGVPDRKCIHKNYHYPSIMTSRGCPFSCSFCYLTVYKNREYRYIPHDTIMEDMESLRGEKVIVLTDENFIGYKKEDYDNRKALLRKMIDRKFKFIWGCQASTNIAQDAELMKLMYQAGCKAVFIGFEANDKEALKSVNKSHNINIDYKEIVKKIHEQKLVVIASTILGMDNQKNGYQKHLLSELKRIKVDYVRVFYMTAWPGTSLYKELEAENRVSYNWNNLRKDIPTIKFKHYSNDDIIQARKEVMEYFFGKRHLIITTLRWLFRDTSLFGIFFKMWWRNKISESTRNKRAYKTLENNSQDELSRSKVKAVDINKKSIVEIEEKIEVSQNN